MGRPSIVTDDPGKLSEHELLARMFRTLGDPTRLRMLDLLLERPNVSQSEFINELDLTQSRASEHLACLVWCGLVESQRRGRTVRYQLDGPTASNIIHLARRFMEHSPNAFGNWGAPSDKN